MNLGRSLVIALLFILLPIERLVAQQELDLEDFIDRYFDLPEEDLNYEELYESLYQYYREPINLNRATRDELQELHLLTQAQLNSFFHYIDKNGALLSIFELQAIPGFDAPTIEKLKSFIFVPLQPIATDRRPLVKKIFQSSDRYILWRMERTMESKPGYEPDPNLNGDTPYDGTPYKLYGRIKISQYQDFSLGATFEKDAGEKVTWDKSTRRYGMDFYSFHFLLKNKGALKRLVVGDYQIQFGQGLLLGAGFNIGKGAETVAPIRRSSLGILPYTSVRESGYFRGLAGTLGWKQFDFTTFYSYSRMDASLTQPADTGDPAIQASAIRDAGLHRTSSELEGKANLPSQTWGGNWLYNSPNRKLQVGITFLNTRYDIPVKRTERRYNQYEFQGKNNYNAGAFYSYNWRNFNLFGELAYGKSGGYGALLGLVGSLSQGVEMSLLWRHYDRNFHSFFGHSFSENTRNINEQGFYWGLKITPHKKITLSAYLDYFKFPWLKFRVDAPSQGWGYFARLSYRPQRKIHLYLQLKQEEKEINQGLIDRPINFLEEGVKSNYTFNLNWDSHANITLRSKVQFSTYRIANRTTEGYLMAQDINLNAGQFNISARVALFDTDDFDNRQYIFERDVLYAFSLPALNGRGIRTYLILNYQPHPQWDFWIKVARTGYSNVTEIGSGLETISGNQRSDVKFQVRFRF